MSLDLRTKHLGLTCFQTLNSLKYVGVSVFDSKSTDDNVDKGDDEDDNSGSIVEDIGCLLVILFIDVKAAQNEEEKSNKDLKNVCQIKHEIIDWHGKHCVMCRCCKTRLGALLIADETPPLGKVRPFQQNRLHCCTSDAIAELQIDNPP